jgi:4-hydroxy-4-methyl-2-oxoglutarate aldolase
VTQAYRLRSLGTATLGEAAPDAALLNVRLAPLAPGMRVAGPARTVRCVPGDNLALHLAISAASVGDVLVVDYGGSLASGPFGEIMALACQMRGIAGMVIDGAVRDTVQIAALGFPVFARGIDIRGTIKHDRGEIDAPLEIGGAHITSGDMIVADADAVIVLPATTVATALAEGEARQAKEALMMDRLRAGETTLEILGLKTEDAL